MLAKDLNAALRTFTDQGMRQMNKQIISVQHGRCNDRIMYKAALLSLSWSYGLGGEPDINWKIAQLKVEFKL